MVDQAFARRLAPCAGLRNRLVQEYEAIDPAMIFDALEGAATDIAAYLQAIERYLRALESR